ncbi:hypothetical protein ABBQ38_012708 [Trebouxia sp. C0009 RCD-2024]
MPQIRSDRRKDRVEASPEQLSRCAQAAEQFTSQGGVRTRVIGWYHSHPHITVLPSHVDIKTQATYQMLDDGFVGLIFSTFNQDSRTKSQSVSVTAFQSVPADDRLTPALSLLAGRLPSMDADMAQAIQLSLAEARNSASADSVAWQRKGVPLRIVKSQGPMEHTLTDLVALAKVLYQEEQKAFHAAMAEDTDRQGTIDPLAAIQHGTMYQQNLCRLMELVLAPMLASIQTCCTQQQLQKQFGHLGNSVYNMQMQPQSAAAAAAAAPGEASGRSDSLSTTMAELLGLSEPSGDAILTPSPSGSAEPSAAQHWHESQTQQQFQSQLVGQQQQPGLQAQTGGQVQSQPGSHAHANHQSRVGIQQAPQSTAYAASLSQALSHQQSPGKHPDQPPPAQLTQGEHSYHDHTGSSQEPHASLSSGSLSPAPQSSSAQPVSVSIITPAVWESQNWGHAQHGSFPSHAEPAQQDQDYSASAPAASSDDLRAAYGSSPYQSSPQLPAQLPPDIASHPSSSLPVASSHSRRSIATNTQLTMHRGSSDPHRADALPSSSAVSVSQAALPQQTVSSGLGYCEPGTSGMGYGSGRAPLHNQTLQSSRSSSSLNQLPSMEGLEGRSSGQAPMRAGSPALGGQSFPKPPSWSPHLHDPFSDLVRQDLKRVGSNHSNAGTS